MADIKTHLKMQTSTVHIVVTTAAPRITATIETVYKSVDPKTKDDSLVGFETDEI